MKRFLALILTAALALAFAGCGEQLSGPIELKMNSSILDMLMQQAGIDVTTLSSQEGVHSFTSEDGNIAVLTISPEFHQQLLNAAYSAIDDAVFSATTEEGAIAKEVIYSEDGTVFEVMVDIAEFEERGDVTLSLGFFLCSGMYQSVQGVAADKIKTTVHFKDVATGGIIETVVYPQGA